jgi:hypothetical protein
MLRRFAGVLLLAIATSLAAHSQAAKDDQAKVYLDGSPDFDTNIAAALSKKEVPVTVTLDKASANYILRSTAVATHSESGASKIARCMFAYCAGIEDSANVSVTLIRNSDQTVAWAYSVNKQRGQKNEQSMAEAIAKHLKQYLANGKG